MWGWVLKVITRLPSLLDTLPFASSWATSVHFLVQTAGYDLNHSNISGAGILGHWQTSDYVWNRLYLTLIHSYVRASDPLNRTYSKLRVFRINMFLAAPSFHQPMTATLLFVAILRVSKEDKTRHLTDGKLSPPPRPSPWTVRQSLDLWLNSHLREHDIRHCHRVKTRRVIELKSTKASGRSHRKFPKPADLKPSHDPGSHKCHPSQIPVACMCLSLSHRIQTPPSIVAVGDTIPDNFSHQSGD